MQYHNDSLVVQFAQFGFSGHKFIVHVLVSVSAHYIITIIIMLKQLQVVVFMSTCFHEFLYFQKVLVDGTGESPVHIVGGFLSHLFQGHVLPQGSSCSPMQSTLFFPRLRTRSVSWKYEYAQSLHYCANFSQGELICHIISLYSHVPESVGKRGIPECFEVLRCQSTTSEEELSLFLKRASQYPRQYIVLEVNKLPYKLQEVSI